MKESPKTILIQPGLRWMTWAQLIQFREVLRMLVVRDLKARYAQTLLGAFWVGFQPLFTVGIFTVVFGRWVKLETEGIPYMIFAFSGLVIWTFVSQIIQRASHSLITDARLITKVYIPRILIPLSSVVGALIDFGILTIVLCIMIKIQGISFTWNIFALPLCLVPLCFFAFGIGALMSAISVYYRDVSALIPLFLQTWMYGSPIVYSCSVVPQKWLWLYQCNPLVGALDAIRWTFLGLPAFPLFSLSISYIVSSMILIAGVICFTYLERDFADFV